MDVYNTQTAQKQTAFSGSMPAKAKKVIVQYTFHMTCIMTPMFQSKEIPV